MKGLILCLVDDSGDNDCKCYYCDGCYVDSTGGISESKFSITIKITVTV
jgi:hypothetical protein